MINMRTNRTIAVVLTALLALGGCAVVDKIESSPMASHLVTSQLTLRFIAGSDDPVARAEGVRSVVAKVRSDVSGTQSYSIAELDQVVREQISWQSYSVADQALLDMALTKAATTLTELIGEGAIDPGQTETVDTLLTWIDNAALRVI